MASYLVIFDLTTGVSPLIHTQTQIEWSFYADAPALLAKNACSKSRSELLNFLMRKFGCGQLHCYNHGLNF